jgi:Rrf2 family nitric oxide-sensitive transcriptional repressor
MQLTKFTDYSLRVLMYIAKKETKLSTVAEIATYYSISQNHLVKIVHNLSLLGYIESLKGKNGGIKLLKKPKDINLKALILEIEPNFFIFECFDKNNNTCIITEMCSVKEIINESLLLFLNNLEKYSLDDTLSKLKF